MAKLRPASEKCSSVIQEIRGPFEDGPAGRLILTHTGQRPDASGGVLPWADGAQRVVIGPLRMLAALLPGVWSRNILQSLAALVCRKSCWCSGGFASDLWLIELGDAEEVGTCRDCFR